MCYICGKSSNKIIHFPTCGYVQQIPKKNRSIVNLETKGDC